MPSEMQRNRGDSSSSSPETIFAGVRFVLFGFDSVSEAQYRSELISRGGTDSGRYDSSCTHVIVCGRVSDDPVCVAARHDGKILVTELWIDDSLDFGMPADTSRILYRPVKDLNGIPGSESLCICLTGYQRQGRDDVMRMVSLMGARFVKPLIANQVTHLICYKFEGEKYELAKRVNIKLVNHRWLEDCLKAWEILPIDNYTKSSLELEILEAQAKDSEDEAEDPSTNTLWNRSPMAASSLRGGTTTVSVGSDVSIPTDNKSNPLRDTVAAKESHGTEDSFKNHRGFSNLCKETSPGKVLDISDPYMVLRECGHHDAGGSAYSGANCAMTDGKSGGSISLPCDANLNINGNELSINSRTFKQGSPPSNAVDKKLSNPTYLKKTSRKLVSAEETSNILPTSPQRNLEVSQSTLGEARGNHLSAEIQSPTTGASAHHLEAPSSCLPQKRKNFVSGVGVKSPKSELQNSKACTPPSPSSRARSAQLETSSDLPHGSNGHGLGDINNCSAGAAILNSKATQQTAPSKFKSLNYKKKSLKQGQPASGTKISNNAVSPSDRKKADLPLDESTSITNKLATLETTTTTYASPTAVKVIQNLTLHNKQTTDGYASIKNTERLLGTLGIDARNIDEVLHVEKAPESSLGGSEKSKLGAKSSTGGDIAAFEIPNATPVGDIAMIDIANATTEEPVKTCTLLQEEGVIFPDGGDSEVRKLSSTASADTCKENAAKAASPAHTQKAVSNKNVGTKKLYAGKSRKGKSVTRLDRSASPNQATVKSGKVGKVKAEQKHESEFSNVENEAPLSKDVIMKDKVKVAQLSKSEYNSKNTAMDCINTSLDSEKENKPKKNGVLTAYVNSHSNRKVASKHSKKVIQGLKSISDDYKNEVQTSSCSRGTRFEPAWFILSGHRLQRKEFQMVIRHLRGRLCRDSHNWSYQATHFIVPDPVRRTEKFFAAAAAGRWILKTDYLTASNEAGKFLDEEPFEWYRKGLSEDGAISLEAPRKWRLLREQTGHGALYGMRIIIYGDCIAPTLDTLKRVLRAGDGTILATSPPYTRFLKSGVDYAIVSPGMPHVDCWVQEFMRHEIPCVLADYLVEYVCKPGYSLERHVLYKTHAWAEKSFVNLSSRSEEVVTDAALPSEDDADDISCAVCGSRDRGEVMLICGDEDGALGCGIGTHVDCCDPPLEAVPEGDWFCTKCSRSGATEAPPKGSRMKSSKRK